MISLSSISERFRVIAAVRQMRVFGVQHRMKLEMIKAKVFATRTSLVLIELSSTSCELHLWIRISNRVFSWFDESQNQL